MDNIILSICIPTYNRLQFVKKQIEYLAKERNESVEIIVSDNNSSDGTQDYLLKAEKLYGITALLNNENIGSEGNMYRCVKKSHGEYIYFLGDDDYLENGFIQFILSLINENHAYYYHINYTAFYENNMLMAAGNGIEDTLKVHNVRLTKPQITKLVSKYFGAFLFISSNIFKREFVLSQEVDCMNWVETLRLSTLAMSQGTSYIVNKSYILCGVNSSWTDRRGEVWFESFPALFESLSKHDFTRNQIQYMKDNVAAACIFNYYRSGSDKISQKDWGVVISTLTNVRTKYYILRTYLLRGFNKIWIKLCFKKQLVPVDDATKSRYRL